MNVLSSWEMDRKGIEDCISSAAEVKKDRAKYLHALEGKTLAMVFEKASTRTRVAGKRWTLRAAQAPKRNEPPIGSAPGVPASTSWPSEQRSARRTESSKSLGRRGIPHTH